jgi:hypothetical protein
VNSENVPLDQAREVLQASLNGSARSWVLDGEADLDLPNEPIIKIAIAAGEDPERFARIPVSRFAFPISDSRAKQSMSSR